MYSQDVPCTARMLRVEPGCSVYSRDGLCTAGMLRVQPGCSVYSQDAPCITRCSVYSQDALIKIVCQYLDIHWPGEFAQFPDLSLLTGACIQLLGPQSQTATRRAA